MRTGRIGATGEYRIRRRGLMAVAACCLLCTCSSSPAEPQVEYTYTQPEVTGDGWQTASLADADIDLAPITAAIEMIQRGDYPRVHGIVIARHGSLVLEEYFRGQLYLNAVQRFGPEVDFDRDRIHQLASVTKSITSTLTGLAIEHGFIEDVDEPVYTFFPEYEDLFDEEERTITVEHLLTMTSGWEWNENTEWGVTVESSLSAVAVGGAYPLSPRFLWECLNSLTVTRFPRPAHRTGLAVFPHPALGLVSRQRLRSRHSPTVLQPHET